MADSLACLRMMIGVLLVGTIVVKAIAVTEETPALRLPADVTYTGGEGSPGPVVFSHTTHVPLADQRCVGCHPGLFSILGPTGRITHGEMNAGQKCGACHDGTKASGVKDACDHCHRMGDGS